MVPLSLPEIFISLYTQVTNEKKNKKDGDAPEKQEPIDLEALIAKQGTLLIEGHPGSGKTTLMKHVTFCLAQGAKSCGALEPMQGYLPLLMFMKDLNAYFQEDQRRNTGQGNALDIITWYCTKNLNGIIESATIEAFLQQEQAVILLDGFDELLPEYRDAVANSFADLRITYPGMKVVLTSRPHGITGAVFMRFHESHVKINALSIEQVEEFIRKWFAYFYPGEYGPGGRTARDLIGDIKSHPSIDKLIDNPLMLTAICILYHDQRELPAHRAELYKRFVDNMLYRRFGKEKDYKSIMDFLKALAYSMHTRKTRGIDKLKALAVMKDYFKQADKEVTPEYNSRLEKHFDDIEARCGLLKLEGGKYHFWHLTFQEFLCARHIFYKEADLIPAIASHWDDEWHTEMVKLYIGLLSMDSNATANRIVENALNHADQGRRLKAAAALVDIQPDLREAATVTLAQEKLQAVFQTEEKVSRQVLADAGELLGWLGDPRDLKALVNIEGGAYDLEDLGRVSVEAFKIGRYPVTNSWYAEFINAGGYQKQDYWIGKGRKWLDEEKVECPEYWHARKWRCPNAPVVGLSWWEACAFCLWLSTTCVDGQTYRLPTEQEWQVAAAGKEKRKYAWGNDEDAYRCNCNEGGEKIKKTSVVGIFELGKTPDGIYDLSGNVWEWCETFVGSGRVMHGGSWRSAKRRCRSAIRHGCGPGRRDLNIGFRVLAVPSPGPEGGK